MKLIRNAQLLIDGKLEQKDILFDNNEIIEIGNIKSRQEDEIDGTGRVLLPGLIDVHVHLREPGYEGKETILTGTMAAAAGGFTSIFAMPNLNPVPDSKENVKGYLDTIKRDAIVEVYPHGSITIGERGRELSSMEELSSLGIRWFSDDGIGVAREDVMLKAMREAKRLDTIIVAHTENMDYRTKGSSVHDSKINIERGWKGIPSQCESSQLVRDIELVKQVGCKYHGCHISAKESVEALRSAKKLGLDVSGEVTAHHLLLEDKDVKGPLWKMNPPLRSAEDRRSLIEGLEDGALDFIASDHAPHTAEEKLRDMSKAPFGIVSLETSFSLLYTEFVLRQKRWSLGELVNWMSKKPATRFGMENRGELKEGYIPNMILVDINKPYVIDKNTFFSKGKNTPFDGWEVFGRIEKTIVGGRMVFNNGRF